MLYVSCGLPAAHDFAGSRASPRPHHPLNPIPARRRGDDSAGIEDRQSEVILGEVSLRQQQEDTSPMATSLGAFTVIGRGTYDGHRSSKGRAMPVLMPILYSHPDLASEAAIVDMPLQLVARRNLSKIASHSTCRGCGVHAAVPDGVASEDMRSWEKKGWRSPGKPTTAVQHLAPGVPHRWPWKECWLWWLSRRSSRTWLPRIWCCFPRKGAMRIQGRPYRLDGDVVTVEWNLRSASSSIGGPASLTTAGGPQKRRYEPSESTGAIRRDRRYSKYRMPW